MSDALPPLGGVDPFAVHKSLAALADSLVEWSAEWRASARPLAIALGEFGDTTSPGVDVRDQEYTSRWMAAGREMRTCGLGDLPRQRAAECHSRTPPGEIPDDRMVIESAVWGVLDRATAGDEPGVIGLLADARRHLGGREPVHFTAYYFGRQVRDALVDVLRAWDVHARPRYVERLREEAGRRGLTLRQVKDAPFLDLEWRVHQDLVVWIDGWEEEDRRFVTPAGETRSPNIPSGDDGEVERETRSGNEDVPPQDREARELAAMAALLAVGPNLSEVSRRTGIPRSTLYEYPNFMDLYRARQRLGVEERERLRGDRDRGDDFYRDEGDAGDE